jgi:hypothetical protein
MNVYLLQIVNGIGVGMLYFLLAVGLSIVFGLLRFVNFAHGAFFLDRARRRADRRRCARVGRREADLAARLRATA